MLVSNSSKIRCTSASTDDDIPLLQYAGQVIPFGLDLTPTERPRVSERDIVVGRHVPQVDTVPCKHPYTPTRRHLRAAIFVGRWGR